MVRLTTEIVNPHSEGSANNGDIAMTEVANTPVQMQTTATPDHPNGPDAKVIDAREAIRLSQLANAFTQDFGTKGTITKADVTHLSNDPAGATHIRALFHERMTNSAKKALLEYINKGKSV